MRKIIESLELGDWFLIGIMVLQFLAVLSYAIKKRWPEAIIYLCYMIAQGGIIFLSLRGR